MIRQSYSGKSVLVTGGAGFIGSHLVDSLLQNGASKVIIVDNMFLGNELNIVTALEKGAVFYKEDIESRSSLEYIFNQHKVDIVFNLATKALNYSFVNPEGAFSTNVNGVLNLLEEQRKGSFETLCHFSTSEVYGSAVYEPMDEKHPKNPTTTYAAGKAAADLAVESYVNMFGLDAFIVRPFNNYGPRQNFKGELAGVIPITARRILGGEAPQICGTGSQSRDFIYVSDTVNAVLNLFSAMPKGESVNISTDNQQSIKGLIEQIAAFYNYTGTFEYLPERVADVKTHIACHKKVDSLINYQLTSFSEGLAQTLDWYQRHIR